MDWFDDDHETARAYEMVERAHTHEHKAKLSHEIIAGAVAYEAAKAYEDHCARNGRPDDHAKAKEIFAALAAVILDRFIETKGLDSIDKHRARHDAERHAEERIGRGYHGHHGRHQRW